MQDFSTKTSPCIGFRATYLFLEEMRLKSQLQANLPEVARLCYRTWPMVAQ